MSNSDLTRIINSDEVQSKCRSQKKQGARGQHKKNPLKNFGAMVKLNPYALALRRSELLTSERRVARKAAAKDGKRTMEDAKKVASRKTHGNQKRTNLAKIHHGSTAKAAKTVVVGFQSQLKIQ